MRRAPKTEASVVEKGMRSLAAAITGLEPARVVDDACARMRQPERAQQRQLARLRDLGQERLRAVHHAHAASLELVEDVKRVEDRVSAAALPCRRAHAIEEQRVAGPREPRLAGVPDRDLEGAPAGAA